MQKSSAMLEVRDHLPLQQGLRLYVSITEEVVESVRDHFHRESPTPQQCSSELGIAFGLNGDFLREIPTPWKF